MSTSLPIRPLKGILKKSTSATTPPPQISQEEARQIALRHAAIIQDRKNLETNILDSIIRLTDFPLHRNAPYSSSNPAPSDVKEFKSLIRLFQPTDYDDLIEERNTCNLCGYSLCGNPRKTYPGKGTWKLVNTNTADDFSIVQKKDIEKWCSQECARRALYVKVQLNETAAWERAGIPDIKIDLLDEEPEATTAENQLAQDIGRLKLEDERKAAKGTATLALERGDVDGRPRMGPADVDIVENMDVTAAEPPTQNSEDGVEETAHLVLEGHKTTFTNSTHKSYEVVP